jgi:hypothetical protein
MFLSVTVAPGTAALVESVTVPFIVAVVISCAEPAIENNTAAIKP